MDKLEFDIVVNDPEVLLPRERTRIADFVASFGQVQRMYISAGIERAKSIGFIKINGELASVGVIKNPNPSYIESTYLKAGVDVPRNNVYEYGYAGTLEKYRRQGLSSAILKQLLLSLDKEDTLFATVRRDNIAEIRLLENHDFHQIGKDYLNATGDHFLKLFQYKKKENAFHFHIRFR